MRVTQPFTCSFFCFFLVWVTNVRPICIVPPVGCFDCYTGCGWYRHQKNWIATPSPGGAFGWQVVSPLAGRRVWILPAVTHRSPIIRFSASRRWHAQILSAATYIYRLPVSLSSLLKQKYYIFQGKIYYVPTSSGLSGSMDKNHVFSIVQT